jgi:hypothetical protein
MFRLGSTPSSAKGGSASGGNSPLQRGRITSETASSREGKFEGKSSVGFGFEKERNFI